MKITALPYTKLFWNEYKLKPDHNGYNIVFDQNIVGKLDILRLKQALRNLVENHIMVNSHLILIDEELYWESNSKICELELFENSENQEEFINKPFNLEAGPLYRFGLFKLANAAYDLILVLHHVIVDGNSFDQLIRYISASYIVGDNTNSTIQQINDILRVQKELVQKVEYLRNHGANQFWQQALLGCEPKVWLPYEKTNKFGIGEYRFRVDRSTIDQNKLSVMGATLFRFLITCYGYLLSRYANNQNIHIAYPVSIKEAKDFCYGGQINTLVLPLSIDFKDNLVSLINKTNQHITNSKLDDIYNYGYLPTAEIIENSPIKHLNVAFAQTNLKDYLLNFPDCKVSVNNRYNIEIAGSELLLEYEEGAGYLEFRCLYLKSLFSYEFVIQFIKHYQQLIQTLLKEHNHQQLLAKLPLLTQEEYQQIVYEWNDTDRDYPRDKTIHQLFAEQVQRTPDNIAVVYENEQLTYKELNKRSNQLANKLRMVYEHETGNELVADTLIALCLDRSLEMIVAILAVLKAGGAYVPLDPESPEDRLSYMLKDSQARMVLSQSCHIGMLRGITETVNILDIADYASYQDESCEAAVTDSDSGDLAYVIYTSGTTGRPKGVMIEHSSLVNFLTYKQQFIESQDIIANYINYTFDAINTEVYPALLNGRPLYLLSKEIRSDFNKLYNFLNLKKITLLALPSAVMVELSNYDLTKTKLRMLIAGGEIFNGIHYQNIKYINQYGPTESTVCATLHKYSVGDLNANIGKPIQNIKLYVLDNNLNPVPIGVTGELYIAGAGLARGYLNNPGLSREGFLHNPFATKSDLEKGYTKMYKTGDLVRWLPDGNLEYIGRNDFQVKIRGFRIELGEIEEQLLRISGIKQACVIARSRGDNNQQYLAAYYVLDDKNAINTSETSNELEELYNESHKKVEINSFNGWNSYITRNEINLSEMELWRSTTLKRIKECQPKTILEIGVGSGLLMYPLLESLDKYVGLDVSDLIIQKHTEYLVNSKKSVQLFHAAADKLNQLAITDEFDCIIINSVCQYFPNINYFEVVLEQALNKLNTNGYIFLGDIRDYSLLEDLIKERLLFQSGSYDELQINQILLKEHELLIAPGYFLNLPYKYPDIKIDILEKDFSYTNELSKYRYDVIISINKSTKLVQQKHIKLSAKSLSIIDSLKDNIRTKSYELIYVDGITNPRLSKVYDEYNNFVQQINEFDLSNYKLKYHHYSEYGNYNISLTLSLSNSISLNNVINKFQPGKLYNTPKIHKLNKVQILHELSLDLPDYMLPSTLTEVEALPLTLNGKLDRNALPEPEFVDSDNYVAPRNELEVVLCQIWGEVLGIERVGIRDDFFRIGGNSILAIRLTHKLSNKFNQSMVVADIFKYKTIEKLLSNLKTNEHQAIIIEPVELDKCPLSFAQERLWFIEQYEGGTNAYHIPQLLEITPDIKVDILKQSLRAIVKRHDILRTIFIQDNEGIYYQQVLNNELLIQEYSDQEMSELDKQINLDINTPFNLTRDYPIRICIYHNLPEGNQEIRKSLLLINIHHIASDGWSMDILLREIYAYYAYLSNDSSRLNLAKLTIQYKDFAYWQRSYLSGAKLEEQLTYWEGQLSGYEPLLLPTDKLRPKEIDYSGAGLYFSLSEDLSVKLRGLAKQESCSLYAVLLSGFCVLLSRYSNQEDIVIGTPITNRHYSQIEDLIGFFVNSLALRIKLKVNAPIKEIIKEVHQELIDAQRYQDLPFEKLVERLGIEKDTSRHPIFQVMFGLQSFGKQDKQECEGQLFKPVANQQYQVAKFDLDCFMDNTGAVISGSFTYALSLYEAETIQRMIGHYQLILEQMVKDQSKKLQNYELLTQEEYQQIVYEWNDTDRDYPRDKTIHQLFAEQVQRTPDNIAVVFEEEELTYKELNKRSNQLANKLRRFYKHETGNELVADTLIALCLDRSLEMIVAILAVLKAGGAYVPLDPESPEDRLSYMFKDSQARMVLSQSCHIGMLSGITETVSILDIADYAGYQQESWDAPVTDSDSASLAYVIYTSGTTGRPKGVMINHLSYLITLNSIKELYFKQDVANTYSITNYVFDIFGLEYGLSFLNGGTVELGNVNFENLDCVNYNFIQMTPSLCELKLDQLKNTDHLKLLVGGENVNYSLLIHILNKNIDVINVYGPTETTVWSTAKLYSKHERTDKVSIGRPLSNEKVYILDKNLHPLPSGLVGELYIGGAGLAYGYLNLPELTNEKFIANPFQSTEDKQTGHNDRLYKTGDLVRYLPDGNIEYIGRNDFQVKIRGFRIETAEIESKLNNYPGIRQSVVMAREHHPTLANSSSNKHLAGYYVADIHLDEESIFDYLNECLPDYMVPSVLSRMETLPLTINGKLDRNALPEPEFVESDNYVAPRNELEVVLCQIWGEVLGIERVGIRDDFFRIGGNSILAIRLTHKLSNKFNQSMVVADIFKYKTIEKLLSNLKTNEHQAIIIEPVELDKCPLSFAQERLWFIEQYEGGTNAYHIPQLLEITPDIKVDILKQSLRAIVKRHDILRTIFIQDNEGIYYQQVLNNELLIQEYSDQEMSELDKQINLDINTPFNLTRDYPIRICIYHNLPEGNQEIRKSLLLINIHHIASDGWSMDILLREIYAYYAYLSNDSSRLNLAKLTIQYKDFAYWQRSYLSGAKLEEQLTYWEGQLSGYEPLLLPTDKLRPKEIDYSGAGLYFSLSEDLSVKLRGLAKQESCSLYAVLLSGFCVLLSRYSNQEDIVIGTPITNRHYSQIEDLIGFFVNSLALRIKLKVNAPIKEIIKEVHQELIDAQRYQDLPFEKLVERLGIEKDTSRHPIFQVMFGLQSFGKQDKQECEGQLFKPVANQQYQVAKFDLDCFMDNTGAVISGSFTYALSLYEAETIQRMIGHYQLILEQMVKDQSKKLQNYELLTQEEYQQIVYEWNDTDRDYPRDKTIHQLFAEQVQRTPDNIAVIDINGSYMYKEIHSYSNAISFYLHSQQLCKTNHLIGILSEKGYQQVIATLGIMQSSTAYLPLHVDWPLIRCDEILSEGLVRAVLVSRKKYNSCIKSSEICTKYTWLIIEDIINYSQSSSIINDCILRKSQPEDIAYVIFTSGSTGKPKGVVISHQGAINTLSAINYRFKINSQDSVLALSELSFDLSVYDIFGVLITGGRVVFPEQEKIKEPAHWYDLISKYKITIWNSVPQLINLLIDYVNSIQRKISSLKMCLLSGDWLPLNLADQINQHNLNTIIMSLGGATEGSIWSIWYEIKDVQPEWKSIPYGAAMPNQKIYILNEVGEPNPVGVIGEIYIGGTGVALAYWNDTQKTQASFINHTQLGRLYKTSDLGKWDLDGYIIFEGRKDNQVKLNGYRIELEEISARLNKMDGVTKAIVNVQNNQLVGYLVVNTKNQTTGEITENISGKLKHYLPEYMLPTQYIVLDEIPLSANGKVDYKALPKIEFNNVSNYVAPVTEHEEMLCQIWSKVLGVERVGIRDDFFRIGGDSIMSIQLSSRLRRAGYNVSVRDIFEHRNIMNLSKYVSSWNTVDETLTEDGILSGELGLLPIQSWFFERVANGSLANYNHWNQSFLVKVPELDRGKLTVALSKLVTHHDGLRLGYCYTEEHGYQQYYRYEIEIPELACLNVLELTAEEIEAELTNWQSNFDIFNGSLWKVGYLAGFADGSARLYFALHHLIVDAVSWRILIEGLHSLLNEESLSDKGSSYRQWINEIKDYAVSNSHEEEYWHTVIDSLSSHTYGEAELGASNSSFSLDKGTTKVLLQQTNQAYHSEINDLLLTALAYSLRDWDDKNTHGITLEGHGREEINPRLNISNTLGWFTSMYPVKLELGATLSESIKLIKENLRNIPDKGIGFGSFSLMEDSGLSFKQLPPISFNYLGQFDSSDGYWHISGESSGISMGSNNKEHNIININGLVVAGELSFSIVSYLGEEITNKLSNSFKGYLEELTEHCRQVLDNKLSYYTPSDFKEVSLSQELIVKLEDKAHSAGNKVVAIYPANSLQQGFIYHALSQEDDDAYRVQLVFSYNNQLNIEHYIKAWNLAIARYPILRTAFNWEEELIQIIYQEGKLNYNSYDLSKLTPEEQQQEITRLQQEDRAKRFELTKSSSLLRLIIIKQSDNKYTIIKTEHHSIADGWSGPLLLEQVHGYYRELEDKQVPQVIIDEAYLKAQSYIAKHSDEVKVYWGKKLASYGELIANDLTCLLDTKEHKYDLNEIRTLEDVYDASLELDQKQTQLLKQLSRELSVTLNTLVQFAWHKLIQIYTQDKQTIVGTTVAGRSIPVEGVEDSVGLYINTLPLIIDWEQDRTIEDQIRLIHEEITNLNSYSFISLASIQQSTQRLFHSILVYENYPLPDEDDGKLLDLEFHYAVEKVDYPLGIIAYEHNNRLTISIKTANDLLKQSKADEYLTKLELILSQLFKVKQKSSAITLLTQEEYQQIVYEWNDTDRDYPRDKTIHQLFAEQVQRTPDNIAVVYENEQLTYKELNKRSNQLANKLRMVYEHETGNELVADTLIALCLDRSLEMIVAILAVLKAGGAYVPLDPESPEDRLSYMLKDSQARMVLSQSCHIGMLRGITETVNILDIADYASYQDESCEAAVTDSDSGDLAYVIYTSGTTGRPKGVAIIHQLLLNRLVWQQEQYTFKQEDKVLQKTPYIFDVSVWELLLPVISGGILVFAKVNGHKDPEYLYNLLTQQKITKLHFVPSMLDSFILYLEEKNIDKIRNNLINIDAVLCSGEMLPLSYVKRFKKLLPQIKLQNLYGPTEVAIDVCSYDDIKDDTQLIHIGKPIQNIKLYVLDTHLNPVAVGIIGELYIAGAGLSRGYLNNPELSRERFIPNPFATEVDIKHGYTRMYKTGDLVRWLSDGNIEYIGRNDFQVKVRGFRIELGEIEEQLLGISGIKQACVIARSRGDDNQQYLAAYYVTDNNRLSKDEILAKLSLVLPDYMLPSTLTELDVLPLTINGKLDRQSLPEPEFVYSDNYVAPVTEHEEMLCQIWSKVLGVERVGIRDDFFRIGGDSIMSIQLSSRLRRAGYNVSVRDIFEHRNIMNLSKYVSSWNTVDETLTEDGILSGELGLLPIQSWFFERVANGSLANYNHWNQSFLVKVPELDRGKLTVALSKLVTHHDGLRLGYCYTEEHGYQQYYRYEIEIPELACLNVLELTAEEIEAELTNWQSNFDIFNGSLWKVGYLAGFADGSARLYFALHHLIVDAVSWRILIEGLHSLLNEESLSDKGSSYRQWINEIKDYAVSNSHEEEYWHTVIDSLSSHTYGEAELGASNSSFSLDKGTTKVLLQQTNQAYHSEINDLLLTALAYSLRDWDDKNTHGITLEGHGREEINPRLNISNTLGWFTSMYPVKLELGATLSESIKLIKENLRNIPDKGIGFGSFSLMEDSGLSFKQLPPISFNYLGQFDSSDGYWHISGESSGISMGSNNKEHNIININGLVVAGELSFSIVSYLGEEITNKLSNSFKGYLEELTEHCRQVLDNKLSYYTPSDFKEVSLSQELIVKLEDKAHSAGNKVVAIYPANSLQQGFIYHALSQEDDDAYRVQLVFSYNNQLNIEHYIKAWNLAIARYPILRTAFNWEEELIQIIYQEGKLNYNSYDLSKLTPEEQQQEITRLQQEDRAKRFELTKSSSLLRLIIIKQSDNKYTIIKTEHHSIADGWSGPLLLEQVHGYYRELEDKQVPQVIIDEAYLKAQSYIAKHSDEVKVYWGKKLASYGELIANDLTCLLDTKEHKYDLNEIRTLEDVYDASLELDQKQTQLLKQLSRELSVTLNTLVQFAWHKLIQIYTQDKQTIVGTTVAGRSIPVEGVEDSVGLYINTLPLIIDWEQDRTIEDQIRLIHEEITNLNSYSFISLASIQQSTQRLFHSILVYENYPLPDEDDGKLLDLEFHYAVEKVDYPLGIIAYEHNNRLTISIKTANDLLKQSKADEYLTKLELILSQLFKVKQKSSAITLLTQEEYQQIVYEWNDTDRDYPRDKTIHQLFAEQVQRTPDNIAVVYENEQLTYKELNKRSNQLANKLRMVYEHETGNELVADTLIALCLDRSLEMIVAILAVLKAGGAYVPLDPESPEDRLSYMLKDSQARMVLSQSCHIGMLRGITETVNILDIADYASYQDESCEAAVTDSDSGDLAYVIYTSGTTGRPKGVMIEHSSLVNFLTYKQQFIESQDIIANYINYTFDAINTEVYPALLNGRPLYLLSKEIRSDFNKLYNFLNLKKITLLALPSAVMVELSNYDLTKTKLRMLIAGGEIFNGIHYQNIKYINQYGPTESTVCATLHKYSVGDLNANIGKPIQNIKLYVLDNNLNPVPIGVTGELYIAGAGLSRGYLSNQELSRERFISNPFATEADIKHGYTRMYKTGDLVRWLPDGNLEYIGRNDFQVKIRGFRIELGEIEEQLLVISGIKQACVIARSRGDNNQQYLAAYYVTESDTLSKDEILAKLSLVLPDYMLPSTLTELETLPLTINGKVDRWSLPEPEFVESDNYVAPTTEQEEMLCQIWGEVLGIERVGIRDDFFRIGGNSILAIRLTHKLSNKFNQSMVVADIFKYKTISEFMVNMIVTVDTECVGEI